MKGTPIFFIIIDNFFRLFSITTLTHQLYLSALLASALTILCNLLRSVLSSLLTLPAILIVVCAMICDLLVVMELWEVLAKKKYVRDVILGIIVIVPDLCLAPHSDAVRFVLYILGFVEPKNCAWFFIEIVHCLLLYLIQLIMNSKREKILDSAFLIVLTFTFSNVLQFLELERSSHEKTIEDLRAAMKDQADKLFLQNRFLAISAHEMRNFVTKYLLFFIVSIAANSMLLKESRVWNERRVNELEEASSLLIGMLNNTLDMSKLEEGKLDLDVKLEPIKSIVNTVVSICEPNASKKNIKIVIEYGNNLPTLIELDKYRIIQVLMNLIGNAIKFTNSDGRIHVRAYWNLKQISKQVRKRPLARKHEVVKSQFFLKHKQQSVILIPTID
eukprot:TRINITY_DN8972_c0_g3_i1.p1 TRINITY_DN8972_c0_g3~~TRINITY_DN8972_c0_g3_i1.p1  ORF type:complete len:388 (+),score=62.84 TRINITY_DN8972_c0_g3_i1:128-1291(+)